MSDGSGQTTKVTAEGGDVRFEYIGPPPYRLAFLISYSKAVTLARDLLDAAEMARRSGIEPTFVTEEERAVAKREARAEAERRQEAMRPARISPNPPTTPSKPTSE